ncbi:MAG: hypothetical protein ACYTFI_12435 [Planctomycetota bacterium]
MRSNSTRSILGIAFSVGTVAVCLFSARSSEADPPTDPVRGSASFGQALPECERIAICQGTPGVANGQAFTSDGLIWQTDFSNARINLVDSNNDCAVVAQCPVPGGAPSENAFDGTFVHHYNFSTGLLYQIDPQDCQIVATCDPPGDDLAEGLTWDGEALWKGDSSTLYRISTPAQGCQVLGSCPNPAGTAADGLATCGDLNVMLGYDGTLYQIDPATCEAVGACSLNDGSAGDGITSDNLPPFASLFADQPGFVDLLGAFCSVPFQFPQFEPPSPCDETLETEAGSEVSFTVRASDLDDGDTVTLDATGVPAGAVLIPPLPTSGNPVTSDFAWTPTGGDVGSLVITFTATDDDSNTTECLVGIDVLPPPTIPVETVVSFSVEAGLLNGTYGGELVRPVDAVNLDTGALVFSAFPDTILEDIDAFHLLPDGTVAFSTSTDVTQGFGGVPYIRNGDVVLWDGNSASLLFEELIGFGGAHNNIDAFSILPNGNYLLSTDLGATLGGLSFQNGDIVEYDPNADLATLHHGLDEATIFTGTPNSNPDIDALHAKADGKVIFSIRSEGIGRVGTGPTYGFADAPRTDLFEIDPATLDASLFLDGDGLFDGVARNLGAVSLSVPAQGGGSEELARGPGCGLGYELVLPLLLLLGGRRR